MLSKVLSGRAKEQGKERIEVAIFHPVDSRYGQVHPPEPQSDKTVESESELRMLRGQVAGLRNELVAAKRDCHESGRREGEQQARAEITPVLERMNASIAEIAGLRAEMRHRAEKDVVQLALLIAKRILHRELNVDANALTALARVVFERLARAESCSVKVHPTFVPAINSSLPGGLAGRIQIEPDPHCAPGTFIIRSGEGVIDASVDSQLEEITRGLTDRLGHTGHPQ